MGDLQESTFCGWEREVLDGVLNYAWPNLSCVQLGKRYDKEVCHNNINPFPMYPVSVNKWKWSFAYYMCISWLRNTLLYKFWHWLRYAMASSEVLLASLRLKIVTCNKQSLAICIRPLNGSPGISLSRSGAVKEETCLLLHDGVWRCISRTDESFWRALR